MGAPSGSPHRRSRCILLALPIVVCFWAWSQYADTPAPGGLHVSSPVHQGLTASRLQSWPLSPPSFGGSVASRTLQPGGPPPLQLRGPARHMPGPDLLPLASVGLLSVVAAVAAPLIRWSRQVTGRPGVPDQCKRAMLSVASEREAAEEALAAVRAAVLPGPCAAADAVWRVACRTAALGLEGAGTLTWQPGGASVRRDIDLTKCLSPGAAPLRQAVAVAVPGSPGGPGAGVGAGGRQAIGRAAPSPAADVPEATSPLVSIDPTATCWEQDWSGLTSELELDDAESAALGLWLCTSQWLALVTTGVLEATLPGPGAGGGVALRVRGGRLTMAMALDAGTGLPANATVRLADGWATWSLERWVLCGGLRVPGRVTHTAPGHPPVVHELLPDTREELTVSPTSWLSPPVPFEGSLMGQRYSSPDVFPRSDNPLGAWYDDACGAATPLPVWQGEGGHLFCRPTVAGHDLGLFILDTATNCLVIDPDCLPPALAARGERIAPHTVPGLGGEPRRTGLIRGLGPLLLGPLMLERPVFRAASLAGVARPPPDAGPTPRIAGVLGYDLLRHCRLEVDLRRGGPALRIRRPGGAAPPRQALGWQRARFLGKVPHIPAAFTVPPAAETNPVPSDAEDRPPDIAVPAARGLLRLALGMGGVSLVLAPALSRRLGLWDPRRAALSPTGTVSGPGSSGQFFARQRQLPDGARLVAVPEVAFPGTAYRDVLALCPPNVEADDQHLSCYAAGTLGALLLRDSTLVLDYAARRVSLTPATPS